MSLQGHLEDLPLLDILQIVAFSQKTGFLTVQAPQGEAALVFREGQIVAATIWDGQPLDADSKTPEEESRGASIRERIETTLERLIRLREGPFCFELTKEPPRALGGHDLSRETLADGLSPEELLLKLARSVDEDRRDSVAAVESAFLEPQPDVLERVASASSTEAEEQAIVAEDEAPPERAAVAAAAAPEDGDRHRIVLLLEDEEDVRHALAEAFIGGAFQVVESGDPLSAFRKARGLADIGLPFVLVADRGMPSSDGSSFDGGLEAVQRLRQADLHPPVLLMTDRMTPALHARARKLGVARFVFKPGLSRLDPAQFDADLQAFAVRLLEDVLPGLEEIAERPPPVSPAAGVALPRRLENWDEVTALQRQLQELSGPRDAFQVSTLVMKVAREFFERAVLFVVKDEALRGLTGFGPAAGDEIALLARELVIPLDAHSVFENVASSRRSFVGPLPEEDWGRLDKTLGRFHSGPVALLPLLTHRETIAVLLGDNPDTGAELRRLDTFEVFLNQAGLALENVFLQRKLKTRMGRGGSAPPPPPSVGPSRGGEGEHVRSFDTLGPGPGTLTVPLAGGPL